MLSVGIVVTYLSLGASTKPYLFGLLYIGERCDPGLSGEDKRAAPA